ncbi:MAG TPA: glycosyltransferase family 4 protein [Longimicrobiales bacterium]
MTRSPSVLAVFPPLHDANAGGIQVAGRIAWDALNQNGRASLLEVSAHRRWRAIRNAHLQPGSFDVVLFWHLDLLRLAPLITRHARRVVFLHGIEAWRRPDPITRMLLRGAAVLANSQYTIERARATLPPIDDAQVVPLGLGDSTTDTAPADPPIALMISRLDAGERYKGHHEVIDAWPLVQQRVPSAQLWIVGEGDLRAELEAHAAGENVTFFGRVSEDEKARLLNAARCLVLPSRGEGFGLVYLEAMRAGRPCLVGVDAGKEVVAPPTAGLSVDPADSQALADAMVRLLTPGAPWDAMSQAARHRYQENFTAAHFQRRLVTALERIH